MNQPLIERIAQLERSVKRWRLVSLCLALLLLLAVAVGSVFTAVPATRGPGDFWHFLPWVRAREAELRARQQAERALRAAEAERQALEAAKGRDRRAEDKAPEHKAP